MKQVLLICPRALSPFPSGADSRTAAACKYLPRNGWQVSVLAASFGPATHHPPWTRSVRCIAARWPRLLESGRNVKGRDARPHGHTPPSLALAARNIAKRVVAAALLPDEMVTWVPHAVAAAKAQFGSRPPDAVLSMAPRFSAHLAGERLGRLWDVPWVAEFQDPFVGNIFLTWPTPVHKVAAAILERRWAQRAASIITTTHLLRDALAARHGLPPEKLHVISNGYDPVEPDPVALDQGHFHIVHCGQFYGGRMPDHFLEAIAALARRRPDLADRIRVHFVGPPNARVERLSRRLGLTRIVSSEGIVPYARSLGWMRAADLLLLVKHVSPAAAAQVPTKLYDYLSAGKPILALAHEGEMAQVLRRARAGIVVSPTDARAISQAVESLADGRALADFAPDHAFIQQFAMPALMQRMAEVLDQAVSAACRRRSCPR